MSHHMAARPDGLIAYGWTPAWKDRFAPFVDDNSLPARIVRVDRGSYQAATWTGVVRCLPQVGDPPAGSEPGIPQTGDFATLVPAPGRELTVETVIPRHNALVRAAPAGTGEQVLVANVDVVLITAGLDRPVHPRRLERALVLVRESGATPVIILTKADLASRSTQETSRRTASDVASGAAVHIVSAVSRRGLDDMWGHLTAGSTVALVGASGAGKSTLINGIVETDRQATGATRRKDRRGRHTTTSRDLIPVSSGAVLVDTPGLRSIGLIGADTGLAHTFTDVEQVAATCRFRDCRHASEPGCAVRRAINDGRLTQARVESYFRLDRELAYEARRAAQRARRNARRPRRDTPWKSRSDDEW